VGRGVPDAGAFDGEQGEAGEGEENRAHHAILTAWPGNY
jgi:hypothetical protein